MLAQGFYSSVVPELVEVIWEMDTWSIAKQTGLYFILSSFSMFLIAYFIHWMEHSLIGFICYFGVFLVIFIVIWIIQCFILNKTIRKMNGSLNTNHQ